MIRIMFICHGNICRSPMAEFIMKKLVADAGLTGSRYCTTPTQSSLGARGRRDEAV